jgi:hypothetical protein
MADGAQAPASGPGAEGDGSIAGAGAGTGPEARVVDTYGEAEKLIQGGIMAFSRAFVDVVQQQIQSPSSVSRALLR